MDVIKKLIKKIVFINVLGDGGSINLRRKNPKFW